MTIVEVLQKEDLEEFNSPDKCIQAGACYAFSTSFKMRSEGEAEPISDLIFLKMV